MEGVFHRNLRKQPGKGSALHAPNTPGVNHHIETQDSETNSRQDLKPDHGTDEADGEARHLFDVDKEELCIANPVEVVVELLNVTLEDGTTAKLVEGPLDDKAGTVNGLGGLAVLVRCKEEFGVRGPEVR